MRFRPATDQQTSACDLSRVAVPILGRGAPEHRGKRTPAGAPVEHIAARHPAARDRDGGRGGHFGTTDGNCKHRSRSLQHLERRAGNAGEREYFPSALGALASTPGAYDLESLLAHELGHVFGLDHSGVWRAMVFPFAPPPGTFLGERPSVSSPDAPLADDDRAGLRSLYPDAADAVDIGFISGRVLPANPFALADFPATSPGEYLTGIFGAQAVAVDAASGSVIAATVGGWSCDPSTAVVQFDGSYSLGPLPIGRSYVIYAEPFAGPVQANDVAGAFANLCGAGASASCTAPAVNTNFAPRIPP